MRHAVIVPQGYDSPPRHADTATVPTPSEHESPSKPHTQASNHPPARRFLDRRTANGNTKKEAIRALKRRLSDVVYRALLADAHSPQRLAA